MNKQNSISYLVKVFFIFALLCANYVNAQQDTIYWNKERPLAWEDFKGVPESNAIESAQASSGVALKFQYRKDVINDAWDYRYKVYSYFLPELSWYKPNEINYYLLEHEQNHFHISEFFARKLKKELSELIASESVGNEAERVYNKIQKEHAAFQNKYDRESKHSLNVDKELEWQERVLDSLNKYNDWK